VDKRLKELKGRRLEDEKGGLSVKISEFCENNITDFTANFAKLCRRKLSIR
jgi:hypothetical protein